LVVGWLLGRDSLVVGWLLGRDSLGRDSLVGERGTVIRERGTEERGERREKKDA